MRTLHTTFATTLCLASTFAVLTVLRDTPAGAPSSALVEERATLAGKLLVAAPGLDDPYFAGTVIYLLADDEDGSLGVVINRARAGARPPVTIWDGGPVGRDRVFVLHDDLQDDGSVRIGDVAVAAEPAILDAVFAGKGPGRARVFVGYAGWGPGQLDGELAAGAWRVHEASASLVLGSTPY